LERGSRQMEWHLSKQSWEKKILEAGFEIVDQFKGVKSWWQFIWILK